MKCIKYVITALLALFCFIMSSELYQLHLQMFSNQYFYIDIENEDRSQVCSIVASAAKKYNEYVFAIERQNVDTFHSRITIYADADTRNILSREQDVVEGEASSFFSGSTEVVLLSFSDVVNDGSVVRYYFTGSKDTVSSIRQTIYSQIATSYIHKDSVSVADKLIYGIWIILFGLVLLLTWVDMQFSKKSDFLKISMGSSVGKMIFGKILVDIVFNVAIFGAVYAILQSRLFLSYKLNFALYTLLIFFVLNSLLYLTLLKVDHEYDYYRPLHHPLEQGFCQTVVDGPDDNPNNAAEDLFLQMIGRARREVYITTPYLAIDEPMLKALCLAAESGVDVRLIMPGIPDHKFAYLVAESYFDQLMAHDVKIYTFTPGLVHGKTVLTDRETAFVGSVNMDYRSFQLHFECGEVFYGTPAIETLLEDMDTTMARCAPMTPERMAERPFWRRAMGTVLRLFAMWM